MTTVAVIGPIPVHIGVGTRAIVAMGIAVGWTTPAIAIINAEVDALRARRNGCPSEHGTCGQSDCKLLHAGSSFLLDLPAATNRGRDCSELNSIVPDVGVTIWRAETFTNTSLD